MEPRTSTTDVPFRTNGAAASYRVPKRYKDRYWLHLLLFFLTLVSTVQAGGAMASRLLLYEQTEPLFFIMGTPIFALFLLDGLRFGLAFLLFLTVHEFGHYFAARAHRVAVSLPYYIPFPFNGIGTFGAVIRIREPIPSLRKLFDIGVSGPLAGFVVALGVLLYGLATLPSPEYIFDQPGHEALKDFIIQNGRFPESLAEVAPAQPGFTLMLGQTPLFWLLSQFFADVPPMFELYHYPLLFAAWLGLFFTALNLLPIGQLDGGHILYALVGPTWHKRLALGFVLVLLISGCIGFLNDAVPALYAYSEWAGRLSWFIIAAILYLYLSRIFAGQHRLIAPVLLGMMAVVAAAEVIGPAAKQYGYTGWLVFGLLVVFLVRVEHPPVMYYEPLTTGRRVLGIISILLFFLCFSIKPIYFA